MDKNIFKSLMDKAIAHLETEFRGLQIGRASTGLVENIDVYIPAYDMKQKMNQLGNISLMDGQTIRIECWDKSSLSSVEKAIYDSGIGLTPQNMGDYLMIKIPALTQERRKDLTKVVAKMGEDTKVAIRNIRQDANKEIKKEFDEKIISENDRDRFTKEIDDMTKDYNNKIDSATKNKSEEIMKI